MRIAICEDENTARDKLKKYIGDWKSTKGLSIDIQCFENAESFLCTWPEVHFDLVFLDIKMKHMSGLQLAEAIRKSDRDVMLVFISSFQEYILKGYDVDALHYIIKPVSNEKLIPVLDKAYHICSSGTMDALFASGGDEKKHVDLSSINYISMFSHTAEIHTENEVYTLRKTADELSQELPAQFIRCHRSYIVNLYKVDCIYKESLLLKDGTEIPVSRNNRKSVNVAFIRFCME